ncbi:MAG: lipid asymmetry maintenance protein MlaB [Rubrivivax sp.]
MTAAADRRAAPDAAPITLPTALTMGSTAAAHRAVMASLAGRASGSRVTLDASALQDVDSSALALLLDAQRQAQALGLTLSVNGAPDRLKQLAALYGVAELLGWPARA